MELSKDLTKCINFNFNSVGMYVPNQPVLFP